MRLVRRVAELGSVRAMKDHPVVVTPEVLQQLTALRSEPKFQGHEMYPGAPDEGVRFRAEQTVNTMLDRLQPALRASSLNSAVIAQFMEMLKHFEGDDTEEREQACGYCERVMVILQIESLDGTLNTWLYGFDPGEPA